MRQEEYLMREGKIVLVAATTAALVTGLILKFAVPYLLDRATRKMLAASALVMSEGLTALASNLELSISAAETPNPNGVTTTTWPVPQAALNYVN
jgi:hypothetical protein